jgi:hypothetical protein
MAEEKEPIRNLGLRYARLKLFGAMNRVCMEASMPQKHTARFQKNNVMIVDKDPV